MNREKIATALKSLEAYRESHLVPAYFLNALADLRKALSTTPAQTYGIAIISQERQRHFDVEGWTPEHDDEHAHGEMAIAAACYAVEHTDASVKYPDDDPEGSGWPWGEQWWKPKDEPRNLARAGALIAAEIDRLARIDGITMPAPSPSVREAAEEIARRIKSLRGVVIESGNKRDAAFVEGGIAALENLLDHFEDCSPVSAAGGDESKDAWSKWFDRLGDKASPEVVNATADLVTDERLAALVRAGVLPKADSVGEEQK